MPSNGRGVVPNASPATTKRNDPGAVNTEAVKGDEMSKSSIPDEPPVTYAQHSEGIITARSVPVDSAALYEAVNAWVEAIAADLESGLDHRRVDIPHSIIEARLTMINAAFALAQTRYEQRRAAEREGPR